MKKIIIVTGGAGFIGSNLIKLLLFKTKNKIISLDNYSSGTSKNHIKSDRVKYIQGNTSQINSKLKNYKNKTKVIFHFGEFSRIYQSFNNFHECFNSNSLGSKEVFKFCLDNKIKLVYSATSASLGNYGKDKDLSPYAFTKQKNLELLQNLKKWFNLNYEIIFFYNVYGPKQIQKGKMATVIGIFERLYKLGKPLTVVRPGSQSRSFTHVSDTVKVCYEAWKKNNNAYYSIYNKKSYTILEVAKMFKCKIKFLPSRSGERYASALTNISSSPKINRRYGKISLKDYIRSFIK